MESMKLSCVVMTWQLTLLFMVVCEANQSILTPRNATFKQLGNFSTSSNNVQSEIIEKIQGGRSAIECARACFSHLGDKTCHSFQFHASTGQCELLASPEVSEKVKVIEKRWRAYQFLDAPKIMERTDCSDEGWKEELVNGKTEFAFYYQSGQNGQGVSCLPVKVKVGMIVTFYRMPVNDYNYNYAELRADTDASISVQIGRADYVKIESAYTPKRTYTGWRVHEEVDVEIEFIDADNIKITIAGRPYPDFPNLRPLEDINQFYKFGQVFEIRIK